MNWQSADSEQEDLISHFVLGADDTSVFKKEKYSKSFLVSAIQMSHVLAKLHIYIPAIYIIFTILFIKEISVMSRNESFPIDISV